MINEFNALILRDQGDTMKLITRFELAALSDPQLRRLLRDACNAYVAAPRGSQDQDNALAFIQNTEAELTSRGAALALPPTLARTRGG